VRARNDPHADSNHPQCLTHANHTQQAQDSKHHESKLSAQYMATPQQARADIKTRQSRAWSRHHSPHIHTFTQDPTTTSSTFQLSNLPTFQSNSSNHVWKPRPAELFCLRQRRRQGPHDAGRRVSHPERSGEFCYPSFFLVEVGQGMLLIDS
jgi:hypothetical protein